MAREDEYLNAGKKRVTKRPDKPLYCSKLVNFNAPISQVIINQCCCKCSNPKVNINHQSTAQPVQSGQKKRSRSRSRFTQSAPDVKTARDDSPDARSLGYAFASMGYPRRRTIVSRDQSTEPDITTARDDEVVVSPRARRMDPICSSYAKCMWQKFADRLLADEMGSLRQKSIDCLHTDESGGLRSDATGSALQQQEIQHRDKEDQRPAEKNNHPSQKEARHQQIESQRQEEDERSNEDRLRQEMQESQRSDKRAAHSKGKRSRSRSKSDYYLHQKQVTIRASINGVPISTNLFINIKSKNKHADIRMKEVWIDGERLFGGNKGAS